MADEDLRKQADDIWHEVKHAMSNIFERELTSQEYYYLLSCYPYLEICDADYPYIDEGVVPTIITSKCGWRIFDYGTVIATSNWEIMTRPEAVKLAKQVHLKQDKSQGEEQQDDEGGEGTIVSQFSSTAEEIIALAQKHGWKAAEIISGFYPMQRMAWIAASLKDYTLKGFEPTPEDRVVHYWVSKIKEGKMYPPEKPFMFGDREPGARK